MSTPTSRGMTAGVRPPAGSTRCRQRSGGVYRSQIELSGLPRIRCLLSPGFHVRFEPDSPAAPEWLQRSLGLRDAGNID